VDCPDANADVNVKQRLVAKNFDEDSGENRINL
jgi:hypothetical protein